MPKSETYTVAARVIQLTFTPKYPVWLSLLVEAPEASRDEYQISQAVERMTCDGRAVDHAGLVAWANQMPVAFSEVYVEMKVCDHDYVGVHEAHFTTRVRADAPKPGESQSDWSNRCDHSQDGGSVIG